jgi:hypothetical protein
MRHLSLPGLVAAVVIGLFATPALAQERELPPITAEQRAGIAPVIDLFLSRLQSDQLDLAYDDLLGDTPMPTRDAVLPTLIGQSRSILTMYEGVLGWEEVDSVCLAESVCRVLYIVHTPQVPVFFTFDIYRAPTGWKVTRLNFTDQPQNAY